ncbi:thioredoxin domain-containing protein [Caldalkalibacillus thermarum]|uniref:thioredoxin domain-containing protein n=1 Tax=Caldalkalibacillus thermarum TaxID=296745 RepID=UPI001FD5919B|nr:thioredoxin domain-containing protein [Caldalkalibacillus thermarum]
MDTDQCEEAQHEYVKKDVFLLVTDSKNPKYTNRLIHEKSPYLLQHAHNPVDWYPWGEEAFEKARREDKPVFLSIGYSTCHWCHVMERESFEDEEIADILNNHFVSIKVYREERPDVDAIYMAVCQALTGHGGWPLTIVMHPDQKPFFAATYLPKEGKWGRSGLKEILQKIHHLWLHDRKKLNEAGTNIIKAIQEMKSRPKGAELTKEILHHAYAQFERTFDADYGGFGQAPKFPLPHSYLFLLRYWQMTGEPKALEMTEKSLRAMHRGGIYDHLGYGFARYSVDEKWLVPHFEKMLYDNALLAYSYTEAYQATRNPYYKQVTEEIFEYVQRVMTSPEGGFYSAEDADSEGVEGKFYVWTPEEIFEVLEETEAELFCDIYDVTEQGNFEGKNILHLIDVDLEQKAKQYGLSFAQLEQKLAAARHKLFLHREKRLHPHKDDKILTAWNGLMIAALAKASAAFGRSDYLELARRAANMIERHLTDNEGRLLARYRDGEAHYLAYIDDYAFFIWALHELYFASLDASCLQQAKSLLDQALERFWDKQNGGFFFYAKDAERLITNPKEIYDGATPSGNGVMAFNLVRHYLLSGEDVYRETAEALLQAFGQQINEYPSGHAFSLLALQLLSGNHAELVIVEGKDRHTYDKMVETVQRAYLPLAVVLYKTREQNQRLNALAPAHQDKQAVDGQTTFYHCVNFACRQPVHSIEEVKQALVNNT